MQRYIAQLVFVVLLVTSTSGAARPVFDDQALQLRVSRLMNLTAFHAPTRRIVVFGDSLSDSEGRTFQYTRGAIPPSLLYWRGRSSNGPVWVEYLSAALGVQLINYAHSGARLINYNNYGILPPLLKQLWAPPVAYELEQADRDGLQLTEEDLIIIWIGNNDFLFDPKPSEPGLYVRLTQQLVHDLQTRGAQRIVVVANSDVSMAPHSLHGGSKIPLPALRALVEEHNFVLKDWIHRLQQRSQDFRVAFLSLGEFMGGLAKNPAAFGLDDVKNPCLPGISTPPKFPFLQIGRRLLRSCSRPRAIMFWDAFHPNTHVHCLGAIEALRQWSRAGLIQAFDWREAQAVCLEDD